MNNETTNRDMTISATAAWLTDGDNDAFIDAMRSVHHAARAHVYRDAMSYVATNGGDIMAFMAAWDDMLAAVAATPRVVETLSDDDADVIRGRFIVAANDVFGNTSWNSELETQFATSVRDAIIRTIANASVRGRTVYNATVADVFEMATGDEVDVFHTYRDGRTSTATVYYDGTVNMNGTIYDSVSAAASADTGKSTNGWVHWMTDDGVHGDHTLAWYRDNM